MQWTQDFIPFQNLFLPLSCKYLNTPRARTIPCILLSSVWSAGVFIWWILLWSRLPMYFFQIIFPLRATFKTAFSYSFFFLIFLFHYLYFWETVKVFENWDTIRKKSRGTKYLDPNIVTTYKQNVFVVCLFVANSIFLSLVKAADLDDVLSRPGQWTLFVPTNDAFKGLTDDDKDILISK